MCIIDNDTNDVYLCRKDPVFITITLLTILSIAYAYIDCMHLPCRQGRYRVFFAKHHLRDTSAQKTK